MMNKIGRILFFTLFFMFSFAAVSFANEMDSLKKLLNSALTKTARVDVLNALSVSYFNDNPDTSIVVAASAKVLAEKINYKPGLALALKNMGRGYYMKGEYVDAIKKWQIAFDVYKQINDRKGEANILSNMAAVYFNKGDDAKSLDLNFQSLKIAEEINDSLRIVTSLTNIGGVYTNKEATYKKSIEYFLRAYELSHSIKDDYLIGLSSGNLGEIYYKMNQDSIALIYLYESAKAFKGTEAMPYADNYIGRVYTRRKEFDKAIEKHMQAYDLSKKLDTRLDIAQSLIGLGQAYNAKGENAAAVDAYKRSIEYSLPLNATAELRDAYQGLSNVFKKQKDFANAFKYHELLLNVKDTIYNIDTDKKLGSLEFVFNIEKKESEIKLLNKDKEIQKTELQRQKLVRNGFIGGFTIVLLFASVFFTQRNKISKGKKRSDELLLNILPEETAEELKATGVAKTKSFELVSVLFTDFKNFTQASELLTPEELVAEINHCYSEFDRIITRHGIEKIKTIGDSYMCAGGLPATNQTHPFDVVSAGLEMVEFIEKNKQDRISKGQPYFELRLGIHTGPVVAGIVGIKKFAYDIWGDTVNTASRMESSGHIGKVNISGGTYQLIKDKFTCTHRGKIEAKNKGVIDMYFVEG
ncbi:MAG: tetratricopeptide repeat protein [Ferruginibacter sp.]|nr:tetratricopeptide repeat protein [Ferruginibacter sp.]